MRLCYVGPAASVSLRRWAEWFAARGHEVTIVTVEPAAAGLLRGLRQEDVEIGVGPRKLARLLAAVRMALRVSRLRPDVVHAHYLRGLAWGLLLKPARPCVVTPWGSDVLEEQGAFSEWYSRRLTIGLIRRADLVTVHSHYMERRIRALTVPRGPVARIGWGVDLRRFRPGLDVRPFRERQGLAPDEAVILSPRLAKPFYRHELVIRALPALCDAVPKACLAIAEHSADARYVDALKSLARELGVDRRVRFVGCIPYDDMPLWYNAADAVVMVPPSDGMPNSLLEAMACGSVPVLAPLEQYRELVGEGEHGLFAAPDPSALADALETVLASPTVRARIGANNRRVMERSADQEHEMSTMERWYQALATDGAARRSQVSLGPCAR